MRDTETPTGENSTKNHPGFSGLVTDLSSTGGNLQNGVENVHLDSTSTALNSNQEKYPTPAPTSDQKLEIVKEAPTLLRNPKNLDHNPLSKSKNEPPTNKNHKEMLKKTKKPSKTQMPTNPIPPSPSPLQTPYEFEPPRRNLVTDYKNPSKYPTQGKNSSKKDYEFNHMFKIINFLEKDTSLTCKRLKLREQMKALKKVAYSDASENPQSRTPDEDKNFLKEYTFKEVIGVGSHAVVRKAFSEKLKCLVAVKVYEKTKLQDPLKMRNLEAEVANLQLLDHGNIMKLFESVEGRYHHFLIMEYVSGRSLYDYLEGLPGKKATEETTKGVFRQIGMA